ARRSGTRVLSSLWHATPPAASQPSREVLGSSPISGLSPLRTLTLNGGPFPPPALPGFGGTTDLSATPPGPACPSRASGWRSRAATAGASRVAQLSVCRHAVALTPAGPRTGSVRSPEVRGVGLPCYSGRSAPALPVSRPARRSLTLRPAGSPSRPRRPSPSKASAVSLPPLPLRLLPAGAKAAGWELHPLKNCAFARRTE